MQEHLIELRVGQTLQVGQYKVTLLEIDGDELCVQIDGQDDGGWCDGFSSDDLLSDDPRSDGPMADNLLSIGSW
ncbi:hypothetical protein [Planctomicrobium piriforme]|uniref:hypothetical protein n=1 Tax=Planctomicrobium piriforme TaxID=1576369 RepID=UPI001113656E|nr:hypothetical protein [Planctomicrobium piriforme]